MKYFRWRSNLNYSEPIILENFNKANQSLNNIQNSNLNLDLSRVRVGYLNLKETDFEVMFWVHKLSS